MVKLNQTESIEYELMKSLVKPDGVAYENECRTKRRRKKARARRARGEGVVTYQEVQFTDPSHAFLRHVVFVVGCIGAGW